MALNLSPVVAPTSSARPALLFGFQWVVDSIDAICFDLIAYGIGASPQSFGYLTDTTASFLEDTYFAPLRVAQRSKVLGHTHTLLSECAYGVSYYISEFPASIGSTSYLK